MNERRGILVLLACIVVLATATVLMLPAISATKSDLENAGVADVSNTVVQAESEDVASDGVDAAEEAAPEPEPAPVAAPDPEPEPTPATVAKPEQTPATTDADQPAAAETPDVTETPEAGEVAAPDAVDPETAAAMPAQNFYDALKKKDQDGNEYIDLAVYIEAPAGALPAGTTMQLDRVKAEDIQDSIDKAVKDAKGEKATATIANAVSITFTDADGNLVEPAKKVNVKISASEVPTIDKPVLARVTDEEVEGKAELQQVAKLLKKAQLVNWEDTDKSKGNENTLQAQMKKFGAFAILKVEGAEDEKAAAAEGEGEGEPEAAPDAAAMPAQNFYETIKSIDTDGNERIDIAVYVDAPEGAFPEGTTMKIARVQDADVKAEVEQAVKDAKGENSTVKRMTAVDIVFLNAEGNEIEPATKVDVKISTSDVPQMADPMLVHVVDKEKPNQAEKKADAEVLQQVDVVNWDDADKSKGNENALKFAADEFSPYVIVEVETITADVITASGEAYKITVSYTEDAGIPEGAELKVNEIMADTDEYKGYLDESAAQLGLENADGIEFARFFDIQIVKGEEKIEPKTPVQVKIEYADKMDLADGKELAVVHFADRGTEVIEGAQVNDAATEITYEQGSFSVTGTIISEPPQGRENKYMVLVNYPTNSGDYYIVNNDGTLTKVNYNASAGTVDVEDPMLWTIDGSNPNRHIYFNTEATGFNWQDTAADYFRRYIDPNSDSGITEENSSNITLGRRMGDNVKTGYVVTNRDNMLNQTAVNTYNDNGVEKVYHGNYSDNLSLGVELDDEGNPTRIKGKTNWGEAANVVFAEARSVPAVGTANHTVDHIDISISGKSQIDVPLAYGTYYYGDPNNPDSMQAYTVTTDTTVTLEKDNVSITPEDMKRAIIKAYNQQGEEVDDAFVIDGYSSNASNAYSTVQVRIGGRFKVADLPYGGGNDATTKANRLANKLTYEVSAVKELTFPIADEAHGQLYELKPDGSYEPISITVDVNMAASFDYWDERNECPGIKNEIISGAHDQWVNGGIPVNGLSGMDFVLGGDADEANNKIVALEITKLIVDENGQLIQPAKQIVNSFDVYQSKTANPHEGIKDLNVEGYNGPANPGVYSSYSKLHSKDVIVGSSGMGLVFDYAVTDGMYYITEKYDDESLPKEIVDVDGQKWEYEGTYITTEYERRGYVDPVNGNYDNKTLHPNPMHFSKTYTTDDPYENGAGSPEYASAPEVLGTYTRLDGNQKKNGFLEYFVHNVYTRGTKLEVEKMWQPEGYAPTSAEATVELQYRKRLTGTMVEGEVQPLDEPGEWTKFAPAKDDQGEGEIFDSKLKTTITLKASTTANQDWKGVFTGLPKTYVDEATNDVYELDYSAKETAVKIPAPGKTVVDEDAIDITNRYKVTTSKTDATGPAAETSDGKVTIINAQGGLIFEKKWLKQDGSEYTPTSSQAVVTAELRRTKTTTTETTDGLVPVTIYGKASDYNNGNPELLWSGSVRNGSTLEYSIAANATSIHADTVVMGGQAMPGNVPYEQRTIGITHSNGIVKNGTNNVYKLENITGETVITAEFASGKVKSEGIGYYIVYQDNTPNTSTDTETDDEKVRDITLNQEQGWTYTLAATDMQPGWTYYINTDPEKGALITETGVSANQFAFNAGPVITTDENGNTVYTCSNTNKGVKLDVEKAWDPDDQVADGAEVTVELQYRTHAADAAPGAWSDYAFVKDHQGEGDLFDADINTTLNLSDGNDWAGSFEGLPLSVSDSGGNVYDVEYTAAETLVKVNGKDVTNQYTATVVKEAPAQADADTSNGKTTITNKKKTINVTVQKAWSPEPSDPNASVTVELHRYAKKTKGTFTVTLIDQNGASVPGAEFKLQKQEDGSWADAGTTSTTDVNGKVSATGLEPGTYRWVQTSVPEGYALPEGATDPLMTETFTVEDNKTTPQEKNSTLENILLKSAGTITLTVTGSDNNPVVGATFTLYKDGAPMDGKSGLQTNYEGKIVVDALDPGDYYFVQTATPEDYKMPSNAQTATVTVQDNMPGQTQNLTTSMTNDLRGKGTVAVTLAKTDNTPISGATFELWSGGSKIAEGTTDANGQVNFGNSPKLYAGDYTVKQATTADGLKKAADQTFTIQDNGDANQHKDLTFTNVTEGKGGVTITLTKSGTTDPIEGASFQLLRNGAEVGTGATNASGQLVFSDLPEGDYTIHQTSTIDGFEVATQDQTFTVVEGNAAQTFEKAFVNEERSVLYTLRFQSSSDNLSAEYHYYSGTQVSVVFDNNNDYYDPYENIRLSGAINAVIHGHHAEFTVLMNGDKTVTLTDTGNSNWGNVVTQSLQLNPDPIAAPNTANDASSPQLLAASPKRLVANAQGLTAKAASQNAPKATATATNATPATAPEGYMEDSSFEVKTYLLKASDSWQHTFAPEDKYDADGNEYYYYVVETAHTPEDYWISKYEGDPLSESGTITVTNEQLLGGLTITKAVTVNGGDVPAAARTIADGTYTFTITGPNNYTATKEITITNGVANSAELDNLVAGEYTITETGSTNANGVTLVTTPQKVTVKAGSEPSDHVATFTNNLDTTQVSVNKEWSDSAENHESDSIEYTLYRIPKAKAGQAEYAPEQVSTGSLSASNDWAATIANLPKAGKYTPAGSSTAVDVTYAYYVSEGEFAGYSSITAGGESDGAYSYTIANTPYGSFDKQTELDVTKAWKDAAGEVETTGHDNDKITFKVTQKKYPAKVTFPNDGTANIYPVVIHLVNGNGAESDCSTVVYVRSGHGLNVVARSASGGQVHVDGFAHNGNFNSGTTHTITGVLAGKEVTLKLQNSGDVWSSTSGNHRWAITLSNSHSTFIPEDQLLERVDVSSDPTETTTFDYSMALNEAKDGTVLTPLAGASGTPSSTGIWSGKLSKLPLFAKEGNAYYVYTYEVSEIKINETVVQPTQAEGFNGETSTYYVKWEGADGTWTITNQKKRSIDMTIVKVAQADVENASASTATLPGATFTVTKYVNEEYQQIDTTWGTEGKQTIADASNTAPGKFTFTGLPIGYYKITEDVAPAGYVKTTEAPRFRIKSDHSVVLLDDQGKEISGNKTDMFKIENGSVYFGNEPGKPLPNTGGIGAEMFTIFGIMLVVIAGAVILLGRNRPYLGAPSIAHMRETIGGRR